MDNLVPFLIIAVLILVNGLFVAAEFAIVSAPRLSIARRARAGHRLAAAVQRMLAHPREQDRFIATAQLGITFASLGLGMYGEHVLAGSLVTVLEAWRPAGWVTAHAAATVISIGILTYLHIVIGEMVPKSLALQRPEPMVLWLTLPMLWTKALLYPLVIGLNGAGNAILRLFNVDRRTDTHGQTYTSGELQLVVKESQEAGALPADSGRLLRESFEFGDLTAGQIMTPRVRVAGVPAGGGLAAVQEIVRTSPHTRYPIYQGDLDHVLGMVHIKDVLRLILAGEIVAPRHARPMPTVPETAPLDAVLGAMRRERAQMALVIDEYGGTAGIVTLQNLFEELVGQLDETASARADMYLDAAGRLRVPGTARLQEVGEHLGVALHHEAVDSVSGLVLAVLGRPPTVGDAVRYGGLLFEVTAVRGLGVAACAVSAAPATRGA